MEKIGRIICYGSEIAPADSWHCKKLVGINRLYYIHSGTGSYINLRKSYRFLPDTLYYIPYAADFTPFCEVEDPIMHTYIDFEMIPPIITDEIISLDAKKSDKVLAAIKIFIQGAEMIRGDHRDISILRADQPFWELCKASIVYLVNQIARANQIEKITDEIVIKSLEAMHMRMDEKLTVNEIARMCHMNTDGFIRRFSRIVGTTPHAYLKNIRLRTANYLRDSGMSLSQIASEVGYSDASSLSHALKNSKNNI
jgi:AraC-like DNA-binding protein